MAKDAELKEEKKKKRKSEVADVVDEAEDDKAAKKAKKEKRKSLAADESGDKKVGVVSGLHLEMEPSQLLVCMLTPR